DGTMPRNTGTALRQALAGPMKPGTRPLPSAPSAGFGPPADFRDPPAGARLPRPVRRQAADPISTDQRRPKEDPMRRAKIAAAASVALTLSLASSLPARADLVIQGRAAQALHCSAMLYMVSDELYRAGYLSRADLNWAQSAAVAMLAYVPGT